MSIDTYCTTFEMLPDEMILELCRYLHCSHILYAFFDLNDRLNRTICYYRQHLWFRRASYKQLTEIYENILPRLSSSIVSLTIHPLHQASFPEHIEKHFSHIFPHLRTLTLSSWSTGHLSSWMSSAFVDLNALEKIVIEELSSSSSIADSTFLNQIFQLKNPSLTNVTFDYDCDPLSPIDSSQLISSCHFLTDLTIQLGTSADFAALIPFIPEVRRLNLTLKDSSLGKISFKHQLNHLTEFSLWAFHWYSMFEDIPPLLFVAPALTHFSLTLSTRDADLIDGEKFLSILPQQLQQLNYSVCYYSSDDRSLPDLSSVQKTWKSIPMICSMSSIDRRILLHTLPYSSPRLTIRSSLAKSISSTTTKIYSKVNQINVYCLEYLSDIFPLLNQCQRLKELVLLTSNDRTKRSDESKRTSIPLCPLNHLDILTIEGVPFDTSQLKEIFRVAPNLSALVIDIDCLLAIVGNDDESLLFYYLLHRRILDLCIRSPATDLTNRSTKIDQEQIHSISRILKRVRNLTIDFETSTEIIDLSFIQSILDRFDHLVIFHIYGKITNDIPRENLRRWFLERNSTRFTEKDTFRIECTDQWFKLWL